MILLIDNYDSFVHNLARYVGELGYRREVIRNDATSVEQVLDAAPTALVLSPGPGRPVDAGISNAIVRQVQGTIPILGVCLGHQCIGQVNGARLRRARRPVHGRQTLTSHDQNGIFADLPTPLLVARYHSLVIDPPIDGPLVVTARSDDGEVMAVAHADHLTVGIQFHPESVLAEHGHVLLRNFLQRADRWRDERAAR